MNPSKRRLKSDFHSLSQKYPQAKFTSEACIALPVPEDSSLTLHIDNTWPFTEPNLGSDKFNFTHTSDYSYSPLVSLLSYVEPFIEKMIIYPEKHLEGPAIVELIFK